MGDEQIDQTADNDQPDGLWFLDEEGTEHAFKAEGFVRRIVGTEGRVQFRGLCTLEDQPNLDVQMDGNANIALNNSKEGGKAAVRNDGSGQKADSLETLSETDFYRNIDGQSTANEGFDNGQDDEQNQSVTAEETSVSDEDGAVEGQIQSSISRPTTSERPVGDPAETPEETDDRVADTQMDSGEETEFQAGDGEVVTEGNSGDFPDQSERDQESDQAEMSQTSMADSEERNGSTDEWAESDRSSILEENQQSPPRVHFKKSDASAPTETVESGIGGDSGAESAWSSSVSESSEAAFPVQALLQDLHDKAHGEFRVETDAAVFASAVAEVLTRRVLEMAEAGPGGLVDSESVLRAMFDADEEIRQLVRNVIVSGEMQAKE